MKVLTHCVKWRLRLAEAETQTTPAEGDCLARHASGRRRLVEIAVWHGATTKRLRRVMDPHGALTAVDPFPTGRLGVSLQQRIARREVATVPNGRVAWMRSTGADAAREHAAVDFLFIDGDHTEQGLLADWRAWSPLIESGGIVALHDSRSSNDRLIDDAGRVKVTNDVILPDRRFDQIDAVDTLTVLRRAR